MERQEKFEKGATPELLTLETSKNTTSSRKTGKTGNEGCGNRVANFTFPRLGLPIHIM